MLTKRHRVQRSIIHIDRKGLGLLLEASCNIFVVLGLSPVRAGVPFEAGEVSVFPRPELLPPTGYSVSRPRLVVFLMLQAAAAKRVFRVGVSAACVLTLQAARGSHGAENVTPALAGELSRPPQSGRSVSRT